MTNLNSTTQNPQTSPLLRETENVSPATELDLVVGYDTEAWPIWETFRVGVIVEVGDLLWRVIGFSYDDTVFCAPHGLGHDNPKYLQVRSIEVKPEGLNQLDELEAPIEWRHPDGLITFMG